ncbi:uncharacterized protein N0V89_003237 [Didymosphaeria variabile]|uniref:Uncharacterized protein n=1 Tax=Didymosphaeria variabile TaxID=1932322 RepID=A0A9W8XVQ1_9PLEO|nr:uncharacterized protein N0V89_003237 [Didymosphaeria variabile]KAJ4358653.1 hypothetical protein N0V89_003237 [Didymosphaeria variabile]
MGDHNGLHAPYWRQINSGRVSPSDPRGSRSSSDSTLVAWSCTSNDRGRITEWTESYEYGRPSEEAAQSDSREDSPKTSSQRGPLIVNTSKGRSRRGSSENYKLGFIYGSPRDLNPEADDFKITEDDWAREKAPDRRFAPAAAASSESPLAKVDAAMEVGPSKQPAISVKPPSQPMLPYPPEVGPSQQPSSSSEVNKPTLAHPITFDPSTPLDKLPYIDYTETTTCCAAIGHYHSRPQSSKPTHKMMTSPNFTLVIRLLGPFDKNGRQPGLIIPQTKRFTIRVMGKGFMPGERKVEIWRNGETYQLAGLIAVMADECGWFLGDTKLRWSGVGYVGRETSRSLALKCGLGVASSSDGDEAAGVVGEP